MHIVIQQPFTRRSKSGFNPLPVLSAKFVFDDYIRCMSARQRLQKRCDALRRRKMSNIGTLLELPALASPSNYYSLTSIDSSNAVWSPSSRGYSSSRHLSGGSSPVSSPSNTTLSTPVTSMPSKSKLLSPKMEQILQRQLKDGTDASKTPSQRKTSSPTTRLRTTHSTPVMSNSNTPIDTSRSSTKEAVRLASLLQTTPPSGPLEITGLDDSARQRSNTVEVGEELSEDSVTLADSSSSFVLINQSASIQRIGRQSNSDSKEQFQNNKTKQTEVHLDDQGETSCLDQSNFMNISFDRQHSTPNNTAVITALSEARISDKRCQSAPVSPRGRRYKENSGNDEDEATTSKSLPAIALTSGVDERKHRAHRARAKAKSVAKHRGVGRKSRQ